MYTIDVPTGIGPSFPAELEISGLAGLPITWTDISVSYQNTGPESLSPAQISALEIVIAAHNSSDPAPPDEDMLKKEAVVDYAEQLDLMSSAQKKQAVDTPEFDGFITNILDLGVEGL